MAHYIVEVLWKYHHGFIFGSHLAVIGGGGIVRISHSIVPRVERGDIYLYKCQLYELPVRLQSIIKILSQLTHHLLA